MKIYNCLKKVNTEVEPTEVECSQAEYCPTYLAYLGKYGEGSKEIKICKNSDSGYCTKYHLINQYKWNELTDEEKIKLVKNIIIKEE